MKKGEKQKPDIYYDRLAKLKPEDKERLRAILVDPLFVKFLRIIAVHKPSPNCTLAGSNTRDQFSNERANARLGEIRGWELYEFAMYQALHDAPPKGGEVEARYPDSGSMNLEPRISNG